MGVGHTNALSESDEHLEGLRVFRCERAPQPRLHRSPRLLSVVCFLQLCTCAVQEENVHPGHHRRTDRLSQGIKVGV